MFRKLSSLCLIVFMTFLVGAKDLALGFCLCEKTLFLGKIPCTEADPPCCCECEKNSNDGKPCDDCIVPLQLEVEDYYWASDGFTFQLPPLIEGTGLDSAPDFREQHKPSFQVRFPLEPPPPLGKEILIRHRRLLL